ncbi:hypothetical protein BC830DRAFT_1118398 [Chytriomyces sp. MP71]|nr:hypothetical protein BC830DRAFT_1118398 [Chytriomyces sp. MP71]
MAERPLATRGESTAAGGAGEGATRSPQGSSTNASAVGNQTHCVGDSAAREAGLGDLYSRDFLLKKARTIACDRCRRVRKRCDANKPKCSRCDEKELDCAYTPSLLFYTTSSVTNGGDKAYTSVSPQQELAPLGCTSHDSAGCRATRPSNQSPQGFTPPLPERISPQLVPQSYNAEPHQKGLPLPQCLMVTSPVPTSSRELSSVTTIALAPSQRPISCEGCRQQKRKCDKVKPRCSLCIHRKIPCTYTITTKRSLDSTSATALFPPVILAQPPQKYSQQSKGMSYRPYPQLSSSWNRSGNHLMQPQSLQNIIPHNASDTTLDLLNLPRSLPRTSPHVSGRNGSLLYRQIACTQTFVPACEDNDALRWRVADSDDAVGWDHEPRHCWSDGTVGGPGGAKGFQPELLLAESHVHTINTMNLCKDAAGEGKVTDMPEWLRVLLE